MYLSNIQFSIIWFIGDFTNLYSRCLTKLLNYVNISYEGLREGMDLETSRICKIQFCEPVLRVPLSDAPSKGGQRKYVLSLQQGKR